MALRFEKFVAHLVSPDRGVDGFAESDPVPGGGVAGIARAARFSAAGRSTAFAAEGKLPEP